MPFHLDRALVLLQQSRPELAEKELRGALADDPDNGKAHALLAMCLAERDAFDEAEREARLAVELGPDDPFAFYSLAMVLDNRRRLKEAAAAIQEAIQLDPEDPEYHAVDGSIHYQRRDWRAALAAADQGLEFDPEHIRCTNLRAMALVKLGRKDQAEHSIRSALARDPDNALTHANQGWAALEAGEPKRAMEHFREALRLEPGMEWARVGVVSAMKARNVIYRVLLGFFLWMAKLPAGTQWAIVIGGVVGYQVMRNIADNHPALAPFLWPLMGVYLVFVLLTWLADPMFNLVLRLNKFGRHALSRGQIVESNWVGACLALCLAAFIAFAVTGRFIMAIIGALMGVMALPIVGVSRCSPGWPRRTMIAYAGIVAAAGIWPFVLLLLGMTFPDALFPTWLVNLMEPSLFVCFFGAVLSTWVVNVLAQIEPKK